MTRQSRCDATTMLKWAGAAAGVAIMFTAGAMNASAYPARVRASCEGDYLQFCPHYEENSPKLRGCMRSHGKSLSPNCLRALIDAGYVSKKEIAAAKKR